MKDYGIREDFEEKFPLAKKYHYSEIEKEYMTRDNKGWSNYDLALNTLNYCWMGYKSRDKEIKDLKETLSDIKMIVNHTEELNMANYDESLVSDMNNSFIAISEALLKIKGV